MKLAIALLAAFYVAILCAVAASANPRTEVGHTSRVTRVRLQRTRIGTVLSTSSGFTLYEFGRDRVRHDSCARIRGCLAVWPALRTSGRPLAGRGVRASLLSTIRLPGGARQVTYAGHPLYRYSGDFAAGETGYVGVVEFGGRWSAVGPHGHAVVAKRPAPTPTWP